jgi:hypothetical protein
MRRVCPKADLDTGINSGEELGNLLKQLLTTCSLLSPFATVSLKENKTNNVEGFPEVYVRDLQHCLIELTPLTWQNRFYISIYISNAQ